MLLADQGQPLAPGEFFIDCEVETPKDFADFIRLIEKKAREGRDAMPFQHAIKFWKQVNDKIGGQISHCEVNGIRLYRVQRAAERPDTIFAIALDVCIRDLCGNRINIASDNLFCP